MSESDTVLGPLLSRLAEPQGTDLTALEHRVLKPASRILVRILAAFAASGALLLIVAIWLISAGPVSLGFLTPYFENALSADASGYRVEYEDTVLTWEGWERNLDLRAKDVRIVDETGGVVARAPEISLTLSASALIRGVVAPTYIELMGPQIRIVRTADGRILFGNAEDPGEGQAGAFVQALVAALRQPPDPDSPTGFLTQLRISNAVVTIDDRVTGIRWLAPDLNAELVRHPDTLTGDLDLQLAVEGGPVRLSVAAEYALETGTLTMGAVFDGLDPSRFAADGEILAYVGGVHTLVSGTASAVVDDQGKVTRIDFDLAAGAGTIDWPDIWSAPVAFDQMAMRGAVVDGLSAVRFDELFAESDGAVGEFSGLLTIGEAGLGVSADGTWSNVAVNRLDALWPLDLAPRSRDWVITSSSAGMIPEGAVRLRMKPGQTDWEQLEPGAVDLTFSFAGAAATLHQGELPLVGARGFAQLTTTAFDLTLEEGEISGLEITEGVLHIDGLDTTRPSMVIDMVVSGTTADAVKVLARPPVNFTEIVVPGAAPFGGVIAARTQLTMPVQLVVEPSEVKFATAVNIREFSFEATQGRFVISRGALTVRADANSAVVSGDVEINGVPLEVELRHGFIPGAGPNNRLSVRGIVNDADRDALGFGTGTMVLGAMGISAEIEAADWIVTRAGVALDLTQTALDIPVESWVKPAGVAATGRLDIIRKPDGVFEIPAFSVEAPTLAATGALVFDPDLGATGTAVVNQIPVGFSWAPGVEQAGVAGGPRLALTTILDDAARSALGLSTGDWLTGPVAAAAEVQIVAGQATAMVVSLNLQEAAMGVAGLSWSKPPGIDGVAQLTFGPDEAGFLQIRSFAVSAEGLAASGSLQMGPGGEFQRLNLARLVLDENNFAATISPGENGALLLAIQGERFDLRPFMDRLFDPLAGLDAPLDVSLTFDQVIIGDRRSISDVQGVIAFNAGRVRSADTLGLLPNGAPMTVKFSDLAGEQNIVITSPDAGAFLSTFDLFHGAAGGNLTLAARVDHDLPGEPMVGVATVDEFRLIEAPAMAQFLSAASLTGLGDLLQGSGIQFVGFEAPFTAEGGVVTLGQSRAWGRALGITVEGQFSRRQDLVALQGTLVPAYTINSVLGAIPLLGELIIGEGAFALNYQVTERMSAPVVTVNPLSALTPGFLRGIIFGFGGNAPDADPDAPVEEDVEEEEVLKKKRF